MGKTSALGRADSITKNDKNNCFRKGFFLPASNSPYAASYKKRFSEGSFYCNG
jgi:hypothetical protein